ncbi:diguanylate cyclase [Clostridium tagluense]|uniref:diguanylate cyclase n=1 Tax=Clostridium tagluense TaxID=360422 RepID=UPI001C6E9CCD|nr:diguanylate cyclase [Clostridium tagluense]MBW9155621.1 diguanylate cyclase [Clostridium tagluense]WLC65224.1 diguanylate cyclase [Clostridium tagluense]
MMLKKEKSLIITLSIIILAALLYAIFTLNKLSNANTSSNIKAQKGVLELSNWNFHKDGYTSLGGQWEFYWQQLLTPEDFATSSPLPSYIEMPMEWNKYNKNYSSNGYATYTLTIKLNDKYKNTLLGISVPSMLSAYKLWVNGDLFSSNGIVGTSASSERPGTIPLTSYFMNKSNKIHLVLQVSNYNFRNGGTQDKIYLGTQSQMANKREASIALEILYFGVVLIMGLYQLWLYAFRTDDTPKLYFGALCITLSLIALTVGNKYFFTMYNNLSYSLGLKLKYLTFYVGVYFMINYIHILFKNNYSKWIRNGCKLFCFFFITTTIFISPLLSSKFLMIFQIFTLLMIVYAAFIILKSYHSKKQGSLIIAISCLVPIAITAMSILRYLGLNNINDYSLSGFLLLILLNAFMLAMNESKAYRKIENLSKEKEQYLLAEKLTKVTLLLNSTLNLQEVLDKLLENLKELVPYDSASFFMEENNRFNVMAGNGFENVEDIYIISINKDDDKLFKEICKTKTTLLVSDVKEDPRFSLFIDNFIIESWMGIPILFKNEIVGILTLDSTQKNIYTKYHCDIALYFAFHAGMAIENAKLHGRTKQLASIDPLTSLYNRRSFFELANINFDKAKSFAQTISGIMMDIDDFKKINDNLGHHTGDLVLKHLSKICSETLSNSHILGRFGGEEFIVLLPTTSFESAEIIGETLRSAVENNPMITRASGSIPIALSIGVASITPTIQDLDYLFIEADKALYQAKSLGKNQVVSINLDTLIVT